ncbi:MAG: NAD-dependent epimerase/dehydratase family protein [Terrabacter sp.]
MRVLVTGAGGTLGTLLAPALADAGHEPVLQDVRPLDTPHEFVRGDVRSLDDVTLAARGAEMIVHTAAIHGIHLADHTTREFYDLNLTGTLNVWEAAAASGTCRGVVFSSTMGVYGDHREGRAAAVPLHEALPLRPGDVYGWTKLAGEELCRLYGRRHGIPSLALRYGMFVPEPFFRHGIRLLYGGVDTRDVVRAVMASIDALATGRTTWGTFNVHSLVPFRTADEERLVHDPMSVVDAYHPGARELLTERGVEALAPVTAWYPMDHARDELGFEPEHNFDAWLDELRRRPEERAASSPPWP